MRDTDNSALTSQDGVPVALAVRELGHRQAHQGTFQTVNVPAGGAVIVEFKTQVPGNYTLVDHALARAERGLLGILNVEGAPNPDIYNGKTMTGMGH